MANLEINLNQKTTPWDCQAYPDILLWHSRNSDWRADSRETDARKCAVNCFAATTKVKQKKKGGNIYIFLRYFFHGIV